MYTRHDTCNTRRCTVTSCVVRTRYSFRSAERHSALDCEPSRREDEMSSRAYIHNGYTWLSPDIRLIINQVAVKYLTFVIRVRNYRYEFIYIYMYTELHYCHVRHSTRLRRRRRVRYLLCLNL